jgi:hypothetical protein
MPIARIWVSGRPREILKEDLKDPIPSTQGIHHAVAAEGRDIGGVD